jgi:hypothetical protein
MRKWLLGSLALVLTILPVTSQAAVPIATARGTVSLQAGYCYHCTSTSTYTLVGTFTVGTKTYTGTVTGTWTFPWNNPGEGGFFGSNGAHTFTADNCKRQAIGGVDTVAVSNPQGQYPSGDNEYFMCSASIDSMVRAPLVLDFEYVWFYPSDDPCCLYAYDGYFIGV